MVNVPNIFKTLQAYQLSSTSKDADCTRARRDDCCKVLAPNSVGNVFYDLLSISGMPPPHLATNSHILSLVPTTYEVILT